MKTIKLSALVYEMLVWLNSYIYKCADKSTFKHFGCCFILSKDIRTHQNTEQISQGMTQLKVFANNANPEK
jgi:hypothetical protein